jgi:hypothetical protein
VSAVTLVRITCDGPSVGVPTCTADQPESTGNAIAMREALRVVGWTRKPHGETYVDLCPRCTRRAVLTPFAWPKGGRPRRVRT